MSRVSSGRVPCAFKSCLLHLRNGLALFFLATLLACGPKVIVDEHRSVDPAGWTYEADKTFDFAITDTSQLYALHLIVEHQPDFFAQNFYVNITTTRPDGERTTDPVSLQLADKFGRWYGDCGGESCTLDILLQPVAFFDQLGAYQLSIEQHTRREKLAGIRGLRFRIEELDKER